jgi:hypothetical protein
MKAIQRTACVFLIIFVTLAVSRSFSTSDWPKLQRSLAPRVGFSQYPFAAMILATGSDNSIEYACSGTILDKSQHPSHILTTAFCVQDRQDQTGRPVSYKVLIEDSNGNVSLSSSTFSQFEVDRIFQHPNATRIAEFIFTSKYPNGTDVNFNVAVAPYDIGILRLRKSLNTMQRVTPVVLSKTLPALNDPVAFLGYGGPQFFTLGAATGTVVIPSFEVQGNNQIANGKLVFIHDIRNTVLPNETQAVEPGDEGSPMLNSAKEQVGVVVGSWQVNPNSTQVVTFATLGPAIAPNKEFIDSIIHEQRVRPTGGAKLLPEMAALLLVIDSLLF